MRLVRGLSRHLFSVYPRTSFSLSKNSLLKRSTLYNQAKFLSLSSTSLMGSVDRSLYVLPNESPVCALECQEAFDRLNPQEKRYAHHIAKASFDGALIVFLQVSPESAGIFVVLHRLFSSEPVDKLKEKAQNLGWTDEEWEAFLVYVSGFYANSGNYKGFGDSKIVPGIGADKIEKLIAVSIAQKNNPTLIQTWQTIQDSVDSLKPHQLQLGFGNDGVTTYHSESVTKEEAELVDRFFKKKHIESWNSRLFKEKELVDGKKVFRVRLASVKKESLSEEDFEDVIIKLESGDYSPILSRVNESLTKAADSALNDHQKNMLSKYVEHFESGDINLHKEGSRHWIRDVGPNIESYIGFIENYRDPAGTRSEFEGFVACVNKETSKKFALLVERAEDILPRLPWGAPYEKDKFLKPDFTALEVIGFGSSGIPSGINIPNYDDIRQNEGFKNVSLSNVISATPKQKMNFLDEEDEDLMFKYHKDSFEVQVGLHELLGHGSGKLFQENADGSFNFDKNTRDIITGEAVTSWYKPGETWSSKFGALSGAYEECRAEAVGYVLCCDADILEIFGYNGELGQTVKYVNWLNEIRAGLMALEFYSPEKQKWGQAHCYARYVLTRVCLEAGQGFVTIEECTGEDGLPDLKFKLDKTKIDSVGKPAVSAFLAKLQAYKSSGDFENGSKMFESYGTVTEEALRWRSVCVARRKPRRIFVQPNTMINDQGDVELVNYPTTFEGVVQSFVDRHDDQIITDLETCWRADQQWFPSAFTH
ncbi:unnamed protein product [Auanema sp. JU1783]|nr:unnamed protein product [Auanema sp. JU1783]